MRHWHADSCRPKEESSSCHPWERPASRAASSFAGGPVVWPERRLHTWIITVWIILDHQPKCLSNCRHDTKLLSLQGVKHQWHKHFWQNWCHFLENTCNWQLLSVSICESNQHPPGKPSINLKWIVIKKVSRQELTEIAPFLSPFLSDSLPLSRNFAPRNRWSHLHAGAPVLPGPPKRATLRRPLHQGPRPPRSG